MKTKFIVAFTFIVCINIASLKAKDSDDLILERLTRLETKLEEGFKNVDNRFELTQKALDVRFDYVQKQIDFTNNLILTLIASLIGTVMYMWWDRRVANAPLLQSLEEEKKKVVKLENALKEYANSNPQLMEIFKRASIL